MKNSDYIRAYESWKKRLESRGVGLESAIQRLKGIEEQLDQPFSGDEYLSSEERNEILKGRRDAIIDYLERLV